MNAGAWKWRNLFLSGCSLPLTSFKMGTWEQSPERSYVKGRIWHLYVPTSCCVVYLIVVWRGVLLTSILACDDVTSRDDRKSWLVAKASRVEAKKTNLCKELDLVRMVLTVDWIVLVWNDCSIITIKKCFTRDWSCLLWWSFVLDKIAWHCIDCLWCRADRAAISRSQRIPLWIKSRKKSRVLLLTWISMYLCQSSSCYSCNNRRIIITVLKRRY